MFSIIIPVYKNEQNIPPLLKALKEMIGERTLDFEVVFVVDGSPDKSYLVLEQNLATFGIKSQLLCHSRNFGSFAAIFSGLKAAKGEFFGVMAADLQEPASLMLDFERALKNDGADIAVGFRKYREDSIISEIFSNTFWFFYRSLINKEIPKGGVDIFACNVRVRDELVKLNELNTSLVGLLYWIGFKRAEVGYERKKREIGVSAWTFSRKVKYLMDSVFAFTDLPIKILIKFGLVLLCFSLLLALIVILAKITGFTSVPGYSALMLTILFFASFNSLGLGIIGSYVWRAYENTKGRPVSIISHSKSF